MAALKNLLLVEDEPTLQRILGSVLSDAGHHVETVGSAEHALDRLQDAKALELDLVLSDKNLPGMNGLELLVKQRELEGAQRRRVGFMMVTGYPSRESALAVLAQDGDGYLVKPFRSLMHAVADVKRVLDDDLPRRRAAGQLARAIARALTGDTPAEPLRATLALELPAPLRARAEAALVKAGAAIVDADRLPTEGSIGVCSTMIGPLTAAAKKRKGAALVLCDPGANFDDLVTLIACGGGAIGEAR